MKCHSLANCPFLTTFVLSFFSNWKCSRKIMFIKRSKVNHKLTVFWSLYKLTHVYRQIYSNWIVVFIFSKALFGNTSLNSVGKHHLSVLIKPERFFFLKNIWKNFCSIRTQNKLLEKVNFGLIFVITFYELKSLF